MYHNTRMMCYFYITTSTFGDELYVWCLLIHLIGLTTKYFKHTIFYKTRPYISFVDGRGNYFLFCRSRTKNWKITRLWIGKNTSIIPYCCRIYLKTARWFLVWNVANWSQRFVVTFMFTWHSEKVNINNILSLLFYNRFFRLLIIILAFYFTDKQLDTRSMLW